MYYYDHKNNCFQNFILEPKDKHVLVKNHAFGVNRADVLQKMGKYPINSDTVDILGLEFAGEIIEIYGENKQNFSIGDRVMGIVSGGSYASHILIPIEHLLIIPSNLSFVKAASLPESLYAVWHSLFNIGGLNYYISQNTIDKTIYINAASSGIGLMAIQMCLAFGFNVIASTSSPEKIDAIKSQITNNKQNLFLFCSQQISLEDYCKNQQVKIDICLDMLGDINNILKSMQNNSKIICIAFLQYSKPEINIGLMMQKNISIQGTMLRLQSDYTKELLTKQINQSVLGHIKQNNIKPIIHHIYNKQQINNTLDDLLENKHVGKLVVEI